MSFLQYMLLTNAYVIVFLALAKTGDTGIIVINMYL